VAAYWPDGPPQTDSLPSQPTGTFVRFKHQLRPPGSKGDRLPSANCLFFWLVFLQSHLFVSKKVRSLSIDGRVPDCNLFPLHCPSGHSHRSRHLVLLTGPAPKRLNGPLAHTWYLRRAVTRTSLKLSPSPSSGAGGRALHLLTKPPRLFSVRIYGVSSSRSLSLLVYDEHFR